MNLKTQEEVRVLARRAGFSKKGARIASAIAMCEAPAVLHTTSYSDFDAIGDLDLQTDVWGPSYGGFQIRSLKAQLGTGGIRDAEELDRPLFQAKSALAIKNGSGWNAWSTYRTGMYKAYLQDLYPAAPNTYIVLAGDTLSGIGAKLSIDWPDLARWNALHFPYTIYIGQVILLIEPTSV